MHIANLCIHNSKCVYAQLHHVSLLIASTANIQWTVHIIYIPTIQICTCTSISCFTAYSTVYINSPYSLDSIIQSYNASTNVKIKQPINSQRWLNAAITKAQLATCDKSQKPCSKLLVCKRFWPLAKCFYKTLHKDTQNSKVQLIDKLMKDACTRPSCCFNFKGALYCSHMASY